MITIRTFDDGILFVMTQREEYNRSPINAYWKKIESYKPENFMLESPSNQMFHNHELEMKSQIIPLQESGDKY